ncbi:HPP family protein [Rhizobium helianthi]
MPLLVAPMGASAVLLFAAPASPLAQPWSIIGGNTVAALIGVSCVLFIPHPLIAACVAVAAAIAAMLMLNCLHPPSGAVALTAVLGGPAIHQAGYWFVLSPIAVNSLILLSVALFFNNLTGRRYPHASVKPVGAPVTADPLPSHRLGATQADIEAVIRDLDEVVDVSAEELDELFHRAQLRAFERQTRAITCADIMSRDVVAVESGSDLKSAWRLLMTRHVRVLPVVDGDGTLCGIIGLADFLRNSILSEAGTLKLGFGTRLAASLSGRALPRTVNDIMENEVRSALPETRISRLVSPLVDQGIDQIPVVDHDNRLVGIVSQSDLLAAVFQERLDQSAAF